MYRLLDLINESGSNGYVDKVIIARESLERFVNARCPGAYASITKVDFKTLDQLVIKPLGIYGSKREIVRLLQTIGAVGDEIGRLLLEPTEIGSNKPALTSGLYVVTASPVCVDERHYVIYWPEDSTWNDSAASSVRRNRITFMRYLTKICDQVVALLSAEQSASVVWHDEESATESVDMDVGESDRLFKFEVAKTNEQEEGAVSRPGFQMNSRHILHYIAPNGCSINPSIFNPRLLHGETAQGFLTAAYVQRQIRSDTYHQRPLAKIYLTHLLTENAVVLSEALDEKAIDILIELAFWKIFPVQCGRWRATKKYFCEESQKTIAKESGAVCQELLESKNLLWHALRESVVDHVMTLFPSFLDHLRIDNIRLLYPRFDGIYQEYLKNKFYSIKGSDFKFLKERLLLVRHLLGKNQELDPEKRAELIQTLFSEDSLNEAQKLLPNPDKKKDYGLITKSLRILQPLFGGQSSMEPEEESLKREMKKIASAISDSEFLLGLESMKIDGLQCAIQGAETLAHASLSSSIDDTVTKLTNAVLHMQQDSCNKEIQKEILTKEARALEKSLVYFIRDLNAKSAGRKKSILRLESVERSGKGYYSALEYKVSGRRETPEEPKLEFCVHLMDLSREDEHDMQLNPKHIPRPNVNPNLSSRFYIRIGVNIAFHRLLENKKLLLVFIDRDKFSIYVARPAEMDAAISGKPLKALDCEKLGLGRDSDVLFAFDEAKRMLVVCSSAKMRLHTFVFDETFKTLQGQGSAINLIPWYSQADLSIVQVAFVCGNDEVALVDSSAQVRIFSFVTLQFRPASIQLQSLPSAIFSSPDGSCLLVLQTQNLGKSLTAYHWETFGTTSGISLEVPEFPLEGAVLTSMGSRGNAFLMGLDVDAQCVKSIAVDITRNVTEYMFKERCSKNPSKKGARQAVNRSMFDCHAEVWTRFPIVAAIGRQTITPSSERRRKSLTFIAENPKQPFSSYFSDLIQKFEKATRKPAGDELRRIEIFAANFGLFQSKVTEDLNWNVSRYRFGEWLVDLLCLIPIHIAVCRENRFIPLADGVLSAELEQSLLGAEVNKIVDKLSFGWYESIFKSYMALKPVKVVSSMGQQSVGKSFSLNHLVDTSFAGSAMRTTEGVWMSVTPTNDALIVALDFEGVDSVERSAQEDMLLVLFNTAISNLVLFRNNFAFSRDISGLFQSFQSSASVLDPTANPTLFQSTLVIIIKDVVEPDKLEIAREFSLKFQKIVQQEKDDNFISRLHGGKLDIMPWPVIESREFYKLFATLKARLDQQTFSHPTAGEFLHTIKTLMAKLKANDWGTLSQTMAEHRARSLSALLPIALATGYSEIEPDVEPLKNFDTDLIVESDDTAARFAVSDRGQIPPAEVERHLVTLLEHWRPSTPRQSKPDAEWIAGLSSYLQGLVDLRVNHVRLWMDLNLKRFQDRPAAIDDLRRRFDNIVIEIKTNVQLCRAKCASCYLLCARGLLHEGGHNCRTSHECKHNCEFCELGLEVRFKPCGTPAGHPGKHICVVTDHLCGEPCKLLGKRGCLEECTRVIGHSEDEHVCSALVHMCGEPCSLKEIKIPAGKTYSCPERCTIPSDHDHVIHSCDTRLCPATCELCKRLCDKPHLHGLALQQYHLCGEAHSCLSLCSEPGICQIDQAPQSVEATFTGRHETFQFTKYSQVAKRLQCVKNIPSGQRSHQGTHVHRLDKDPFHFCESKCEYCNYYCTLPLGHKQPEHETSHGSMTQARWAVDSPDGTSLDLGGRKFSSNDEGAPMMCNLVCSSLGRHVHIDYCRAGGGRTCRDADVQHLGTRITPDANRPKDAVAHGLSWRRMGFKDPYTRDEQTNFAKCDAMCPGQEHHATAGSPGPGQPSYCTLPMFHPPRNPNDPVNGLGYASNDGHLFECRNPVVMQQAFHVIFVIDRSSSMSCTDRRPLANAPATNQITRSANNRLGAVYSALYSFWSARHAAVTAGQQTVGARRDAYSIVLFNESDTSVLVNDFTSSPDQLLTIALAHQASGGTNFAAALRAGQTAMTQHWSTERTPVMIFLSDGECSVPDSSVQDVCRSAVQLGKPLSFHSVSFGQDSTSSSLRRMAQLALQIQNNAPRDRVHAMSIPSAFTVALDTVQLAQTFLGIAESLRKPRGSLIR
ncbi:hypothetical protein V8E53_006069 [Lactarius tabidus]